MLFSREILKMINYIDLSRNSFKIALKYVFHYMDKMRFKAKKQYKLKILQLWEDFPVI